MFTYDEKERFFWYGGEGNNQSFPNHGHNPRKRKPRLQRSLLASDPGFSAPQVRPARHRPRRAGRVRARGHHPGTCTSMIRPNHSTITAQSSKSPGVPETLNISPSRIFVSVSAGPCAVQRTHPGPPLPTRGLFEARGARASLRRPGRGASLCVVLFLRLSLPVYALRLAALSTGAACGLLDADAGRSAESCGVSAPLVATWTGGDVLGYLPTHLPTRLPAYPPTHLPNPAR